MMNRKNMTASTLDETALDAYYTLTEGGGTRCHSEQPQKPEHLFSRPHR